MNVILSIKPEYCRKIKNGNKRYEFRKRIFKNKDGVHRVFMYATCPVQKIVGSFTIESVVEGDPESLWERFRDFSGIEKYNFFRYFGSTEKGFAIKNLAAIYCLVHISDGAASFQITTPVEQTSRRMFYPIGF